MVSENQVDLLLRAIAATAREDGPELDRLDAVSGDGDFGSTLARGSRALVADPPAGTVADRLRQASERMAAAMGGSSGAFVGVGFLRAARALDAERGTGAGTDGAETDGRGNGDAGTDGSQGAGTGRRAGETEDQALDARAAGGALRAAIDGISEYGGAHPGDKTLLDALDPVATVLAGGDAGAAVAAAEEGAASTGEMAARVGRASYSGERSRGEPDAGATAVAAIVRRLAAPAELPDWDTLRAHDGREGTASGGGGAEQDDGPIRRGFVNDPDDLVDEALDGLVAAHPELLRRLTEQRAVVRRGAPAGERVAVLSGGGAGHEPLHAGFVGEGMLDAACPGAVFTSPSAAQIAATARAVAGPGGVLFVVKRYTGDLLNFRLAAELLADEGVETATVVVADDVAIASDAATGRRGTGTTIAVERIAGAAAATGLPLERVRELAQRVADAGRSFGVARHGHEMELGVGIHGEPGRPRQPLASAAEIAALLLEPLLAELSPASGAPLLLQLSGLGGTPSLELHVLLRGVLEALRERHGLEPSRILAGDLITSLDQPGAVLTLVPLDTELLRLWDAPLRTPALRWG